MVLNGWLCLLGVGFRVGFGAYFGLVLDLIYAGLVQIYVGFIFEGRFEAVQGWFRFGLRSIWRWFMIYLGLVWGSFRVSFRGLFRGYLGLLVSFLGVSLSLFRVGLGYG